MSETSPAITFITGTSASGKTTLYKSLRADAGFAGTDFHDIDEDGTPPIGRGPWREYRVAHLLFNAMQGLNDGHSTVICGITKPHEVLELEHYQSDAPVNFILVEVSDQLIDQRLRLRAQEEMASGQWNESIDDVDRMIKGNLRLKTILHNSVLALKRGFVIEASELSKEALHDRARQLLLTEDASS